MAYLIDIIALLLAFAITFLIYIFYLKVLIFSYIKKIKTAIQNGDTEKANKMKDIAMKKQPKRMNALFIKYGI